jgi:hypothetical protein
VEVGASFDGVAVGIKVETAARDDLVDLVEGGEVPVDERLVAQGPQALGRLQLGGVARQVDEPEAVGNRQVRLGVPAGVVEHGHDPALPPLPLVHTPPSGGGSAKRSRNRSKSSGTSTRARLPLPRRRSPNAPGPCALSRATSRSTRRAPKAVVADTSAIP